MSSEKGITVGEWQTRIPERHRLVRVLAVRSFINS